MMQHYITFCIFHYYFSYSLFHIPEGVPIPYGFTAMGKYEVLLMQLLGPSLYSVFHSPPCNKHFSLSTIVLVAQQVLARLHMLHRNGYVHRDVKPDNFVLRGET